MSDDTIILVNLEALKTEREGMIAENQWRMNRGEVVAYVEEDFLRVANAMRELLAPRIP